MYGDLYRASRFPDGSERDQLGGRIAAVPMLIGFPYKNERNAAIKNQMYGNPYEAWIGFWVRILDSQSILVRLYSENRAHVQ